MEDPRDEPYATLGIGYNSLPCKKKKCEDWFAELIIYTTVPSKKQFFVDDF